MLDQSDGKQVAKNVTAASVIKTGSGRVVKVSVIVAAAAAGAIHDVATTGAVAVGNQIATIPASAAGVLDINLPFIDGLVIVPGAGTTLAVSYN